MDQFYTPSEAYQESLFQPQRCVNSPYESEIIASINQMRQSDPIKLVENQKREKHKPLKQS